jgi:hypothetical protein
VANPAADRPFIGHPEYGIPTSTKGLLPWREVIDRFETEPNYWICTTSPTGKPHVRPAWGVMVDDTIYFGGGPNTRWSRNLAANRFVAVHLESASQVVVAEGRVDRISDPDDPRLRAADDAYEVKYKMRHGPPMWVLNPEVVIAWSNFPKDATRFRL